MSQTAGQVRLLVDDGKKERRVVTDKHEHSERDLNVKLVYQGATIRASWTGVVQARDGKDVFKQKEPDSWREVEG